MALLQALEQDGWRFRIGDPDFMGWAIFAGYLAVSLLCLYAGVAVRAERTDSGKSASPVAWYFLSLVLLFLAVNKQLDIQTLLIAAGRALARSQGWYAQRREVQAVFFVVFLGGMIALIAAAIRLLRSDLRNNMSVLAGFAVILAFVLIRAASTMHVGEIPEYFRWMGPIRMKHVMESGGILVLAAAVIRKIREIRRGSSSNRTDDRAVSVSAKNRKGRTG